MSSRLVAYRSRRVTRLLLATLACGIGTSVAATPAVANGQFTSLQAGFIQDLYGVEGNFLGGVAVASNGDLVADGCSGGGGPLFRFDHTTTLPPVNGTSTLHPVSTETSNAGCGLANGLNGELYSNTSSGVVELDATTGAQIAGPFGPAGNALGIATDPQTGKLVYVEGDGTLGEVDPALSASSTFSSALAGKFLDQMVFDPSGDFLLVSNRTDNALTILRRDGTLVQSVPLAEGSQPDGIAFHVTSPSSWSQTTTMGRCSGSTSRATTSRRRRLRSFSQAAASEVTTPSCGQTAACT